MVEEAAQRSTERQSHVAAVDPSRPSDPDGRRVPGSARRRAKLIRKLVKALRGIPGDLWQLNGEEIGDQFADLQELRRLAQAHEVATLEEAVNRGETVSAGRVSDWVQQHSGPGPNEPGDVAALLEVTSALGGRPERQSLREAVLDGRVSVRAARVCLSEMERLAHRLAPGVEAGVWGAYAELAATQPISTVRSLRPAFLVRFGADDELGRDHERAAELVALSAGSKDAALTHYRWTLDPEGVATLEAALGPLARPRPDADGSPDRRTAAQRRGQALVELVQRAVVAGNGTPVTTGAQLFVQVSLADLAAGSGAGTVIGSVADGTLLARDGVRRLACHGAVLPVVVGASGELLDLGRTIRFFTMTQRKALVLRDRHCTFPDCDVPATWCDAHHLVHWLDGGASDLSNAGLLCGWHHQLVHRRRYAALMSPEGVIWDLTRGSYDAWLLSSKPPDPAEDARSAWRLGAEPPDRR